MYVIFDLSGGVSHVLCGPESSPLFFCRIYLIVISTLEAAFLQLYINAVACQKAWKTTVTRRKTALNVSKK